MSTLELAKDLKAPLRACVAPFRTARGLKRWYDSHASLSRFRVGSFVEASYFPGYEIVAFIPDRLIVQRFTSVVDGIGVWSFIPTGKNSTRLVFHHIADANVGVEVPARTFHWQGLIENLAAVVEKRPAPFQNGKYVNKPRGIRYATVREAISAAGFRPE